MTLLAASSRRRLSGGMDLPYEIPTSAPYDVPDYIHVPTYDGSNQAVHPDVIDFAQVPEVNGNTWRGHRFWLAMTPYPFSQDQHENPSILVSHDGISWSAPAGLTNPIVTAPPTGYNADTELIYDHETDQLACIFLRTGEGVRITRTSDGITWTPHAAVDISWSGSLSPSILRDGEVWRMWHNAGLQTRTAAALEGPWSGPAATSGGPSPIWHSNVQAAPAGGFHLLAHTAVGASGALRAASSLDGITWTANPTDLVTTGSHPWSETGLYRPAFTLHDDGDRYRVWYSGQSAFGVWRIGYTEIPITEWPTP